MSKHALSQEEIQMLEITQLEEVSGGTRFDRGSLVNGIPMPEERPISGGGIKEGGGFPFGIINPPEAETSFEF